VVSLEGDLIRERFGMTGFPSVLSRAFLSSSLAELGEFAAGTARGEEGVRIAETMDHPFSLIWAYHGIGKLYVAQGAFHQGIMVLARGLELCQAWDIPTLFPQMARTLGIAYALSGRVPEALLLLEQAASQGRRGAQWFTPLSTGYLLAGRTEDALKYAQHALDLAQEYKQRGHQAHALHLLGEIAMHHKPPEIEQAKALYCQALALAEELGMRPLQAHCHRSLGLLYTMTGQRAQAHAALSMAIDLYHAMEMPFWLPQAEAALAQVDA
jgi:tetratricopeptide (TPR) repeat protein